MSYHAYCTDCGEKIGSAYNYCPWCGTKQERGDQ